MTADQLRAIWTAQPFRPFALHLADGRNMHVPHREFLSLDPRGRTAIVWESTGTFHLVDVMLITELEVPAKSENGREET